MGYTPLHPAHHATQLNEEDHRPCDPIAHSPLPSPSVKRDGPRSTQVSCCRLSLRVFVLLKLLACTHVSLWVEQIRPLAGHVYLRELSRLFTISRMNV